MKINLLNNIHEYSTARIDAHLPTFQISRKITPDIGNPIKITKIKFDTSFEMHTSPDHLEISLIILGFGITIYVKEHHRENYES